jgi:circadian clock protein KaiB
MDDNSRYLLVLYIAGMTAAARNAIENQRAICRDLPTAQQCEIEIIDIIQDPEAAERENILATPTVIRQLPPPVSRLIGELADKDQVIAGLKLIDLTENGFE